MLDEYLECTSAEQVAWGRLDSAPMSHAWSNSDEPEDALHRIHAYPAKFPAFLTTRALTYATGLGLRVERLGDVFCGCGTVAHEARKAGLEFWGCDINPVAILIARAKSSALDGSSLRQLADEVLSRATAATRAPDQHEEVEDFLQRWHDPGQRETLGKLLVAIEEVVPATSPYRAALLCAFSSILKSCSRWRAWSNKPRIDPNKPARPVAKLFSTACARMASAYDQATWPEGPVPMLEVADARSVQAPALLPDLLVCSAPYATSIDYVELHQLSAAWLGHYAALPQLRRKSIGSPLVGAPLRTQHAQLNRVGLQVVFSLLNRDPSLASTLGNYFIDMQLVAKRCLDFLTPEGIAVFVVGNARLRGQVIDNAAHMAEALLDAGFSQIRVTRRRVSNKSASPYRDTLGRLSREPAANLQYHEEFILMAHRL